MGEDLLQKLFFGSDDETPSICQLRKGLAEMGIIQVTMIVEFSA